MRQIFPETTPFDSGHIAVGSGHQLYYERFGNPAGQPVVYLHGGPGAGCSFKEYRWFDPEHFQVILFNQRGAGDGNRKSTPNAHDDLAALENNDYNTLVGDLEALRNAFSITRWDVCGGSFGSSLAMAYAHKHPDSINRLLLRGVFFGTRENALHLTEGGDARGRDGNPYFDIYRDLIPAREREQKTLMRAYADRVLSDDPETAIRAAQIFILWDTSIVRKDIDPDMLEPIKANPMEDFGMARIWYHFCQNHFNDRNRDEWLRAVAAFPRPVSIIHGRQDYICATENAILLQESCPRADVQIIEDCGHGMIEPGLQDALMAIAERWRTDDRGNKAQPAQQPPALRR